MRVERKEHPKLIVLHVSDSIDAENDSFFGKIKVTAGKQILKKGRITFAGIQVKKQCRKHIVHQKLYTKRREKLAFN